MIARIWHGWTTKSNAEEYEELLRNEVYPSIESMNVKGYRQISLLKREQSGEIEY